MSMFDRPGSMEAIREWNESREARYAAQDALHAAQLRNHQALVRMAQAHKTVVDTVGPEHADLFLWIETLNGNRDQILASHSCIGGAE